MGILSRLKGANIADLDRQIVIKSTTISTGDAGEQYLELLPVQRYGQKWITDLVTKMLKRTGLR